MNCVWYLWSLKSWGGHWCLIPEGKALSSAEGWGGWYLLIDLLHSRNPSAALVPSWNFCLVSAETGLENRNCSQVCWWNLGTSFSLTLWVVVALIVCHSRSMADTRGAAKQIQENASRFIGLNHPAAVKLLQISYNSEYPPFCSLAEVLLLKNLIWQEEDCTCVEGVLASHWQTILQLLWRMTVEAG